MKTAFLIRMLTVVLVAMGAGQSCSSKDDKAQEEPVEADTEENAAVESEDGEASPENAESGENVENADTSETAAESEAVADVLAADDGSSDETPTEVYADPSGMNAAMEPAMVADDGNASPDMAAMPSAEPMTGGTVKYVKSSSLSVYRNADRASGVLKTLSKGDHMLVSIEGSWAKLGQGGYVEVQGLSDRGVGRPRGAGSWR